MRAPDLPPNCSLTTSAGNETSRSPQVRTADGAANRWLYPPTLQRSGLAAALSDLVAPLRAAGITVTIDVPEDAHLPDDTEALFYRVAQEAVRNARTHGDASEVRIALALSPDSTRLLIEDNGRGFSRSDIGEGEPEGHFRLRLMRDLVDHAGGELGIDSANRRRDAFAMIRVVIADDHPSSGMLSHSCWTAPTRSASWEPRLAAARRWQRHLSIRPTSC